MKAKNLFLVCFLASAFFKVNGQTYSVPASAGTGPNNNTNVGSSAGTNIGGANNYENVAIGYLSGNSTSNGALNTFVGSRTGGSASLANTVTGTGNCFFGAYSGNRVNTGGYNVGIGVNTLLNTTTGSGNIAIGNGLQSNQTASNNIGIGPFALNNLTGINGNVNDNVAVGNNSGRSLLTGTQNVFLGFTPGSMLQTGSTNVIIGSQSGQIMTNGTSNIFIGTNAGYNLNNSGVSLDRNTLIGSNAGRNLTTGTKNTFIGAANTEVGASTSSLAGNNTNNTIILADGDGNQGLFIHSNRNAGIGLTNNSIPQNRLEINASTGTAGLVANTMGLRFRGINNPNFNPSSSSTRKVLSVNTLGDVILVDDIGGGITQNCTTANFVPVNSSTTGVLACSQIYDNLSTSVGIGYPTATAANAAFPTTLVTGGFFTNSNTNYSSYTNFRLAVNGITRADGYLATSDKKFKKDIKPIENALSTIEKLDGKTYLWNREEFKDRNFDGGDHSGFMAQDLEKVLPHLVATGQNGDKAVNYIELMPYLVEAIKEQNSLIKDQQEQINELKNQISDNFKAQNQNLIGLENTKIISVSPNPSNDMIFVALNIEKSVQRASLQVYDLNGKLLINLNIDDRENNITRTLQKDNFGKGVYILSLVVNGKSIDSKKIIFN